MCLYVDDILAVGSKQSLQQFFDNLNKRFPLREIQWLAQDKCIDYVGMIISLKNNSIRLSMEPYCQTFITMVEKRVGLLKPTSVPINASITNMDPISEGDAKLFRTMVGSLGWLANTARPDISYAHSRISQHLSSPTKGAYDAAIYATRYVKGTMNLGLESMKDNSPNEFVFFTDSDHAGNREPQNHCRSQLGILAVLNSAPILWHSTVMSAVSPSPVFSETLPALSVGEAETTAMANGVLKFLHMYHVCDEMKIGNFPMPIIVNTDSTVAQAFMANTCLKTRMKHIDVRQNWIKLIRNAQVCLPQYIPTADNLADFFTKILFKSTFIKLRKSLMTDIHL